MAGVVTFGFDRACWHGSGWIPVRHRFGDVVLRPVYVPARRAMIWGIDCHGGDCAVPDWDVTHARFMSDEEMFAVAATLGSAEQLVRAVPSSTCAEPFWIRRRHPPFTMTGTARSLDERARIVEPVKRDGRLIYTFRAADERLVRAEIALDGQSSRCTIDPPRVDDGGPVLTMTAARELAAGRAHTCAVGQGTLACWGRAVEYLGYPGPRALPTALKGNVRGVVAGDGFTCHADRHGDFRGVWCTGPDMPVRGSARAERFFAGGRALARFDANGALTIVPSSAQLAPPDGFAQLGDIVHVALGEGAACALPTSGILRCWGPSAPKLDGENGVTAVALGASIACFQRGLYGGVWCAGHGAAPARVAGLPSIVSIVVGDAHACALDRDGGLWCWGANDRGQLGDGTTVDRSSAAHVLGGVKAVAAGGRHTCTIGQDEGVRCWGANDGGQLGDGTFVDRHAPVRVIW